MSPLPATGRGSAQVDDVTTGGAKVQVTPDDLEASSLMVSAAAGGATDAAVAVAGVALRMPLLGSVAAPVTATAVLTSCAALTIGPNALGVLAARLLVHGKGLELAGGAYAAAEAVNDSLMDLVQVAQAGGVVVGSLPGAYRMVTHSPWRLLHADAEFKSWVARNPDLVDGTVAALHLTMNAVLPGSFEEHVGMLVSLAQMGGILLDDRPLTVTATSSSTRAPSTTIGDLVRADDWLERRGNEEHSNIRVHHIVRPDGTGSWIVDIPGTKTWSVLYPHNPSDVTANMLGVAGMRSSVYQAIDSALRTSMQRAGIAPGKEPVMIVGHSQGGILGTQLAHDEEFRSTYDVRQVVTAGSPVSRMKLRPNAVKSFDMEHIADPVPRTDGRDAPTNQRNRVNLTAHPDPRPGDDRDPIATHDADRYAQTADNLAGRGSTDVNVQNFYDENDRFLDANAKDEVYDYSIRRP